MPTCWPAWHVGTVCYCRCPNKQNFVNEKDWPTFFSMFKNVGQHFYRYEQNWYFGIRFAMFRQYVGTTFSISEAISETLKWEIDLSWRFELDHEFFLLCLVVNRKSKKLIKQLLPFRPCLQEIICRWRHQSKTSQILWWHGKLFQRVCLFWANILGNNVCTVCIALTMRHLHSSIRT